VGRPALAAVTAALMLAPLACLLLYSLAESFAPTQPLPDRWGLRWYARLAADGRAVDALGVSLVLALAATALALAVGVPAAWALARHRGRAAGGAEALVLLRGAVPVIVVALGTAAVLFRVGGIDRWWSLVAAHAAGALPFVVWTCRPAFAGLDPDLLVAARDLGAGPLRRFGVAVGAVRPAVVAGALLAFVFSVDEFAVTFLISGIEIVTLPVLLYDALQRSSVQAAAAVAVLLLVPTAVAAAVAAALVGRLDAGLAGRLS
jgi:putative spermidine/putrescine transport system permease protein